MGASGLNPRGRNVVAMEPGFWEGNRIDTVTHVVSTVPPLQEHGAEDPVLGPWSRVMRTSPQRFGQLRWMVRKSAWVSPKRERLLEILEKSSLDRDTCPPPRYMVTMRIGGSMRQWRRAPEMTFLGGD